MANAAKGPRVLGRLLHNIDTRMLGVALTKPSAYLLPHVSNAPRLRSASVVSSLDGEPGGYRSRLALGV